MTDRKLTPSELMNALEGLAKANGYGITSIDFMPRVIPANATVSHSFTANHLMAADFKTGMQRMMDGNKFTTDN
jgi:hypothetical protein